MGDNNNNNNDNDNTTEQVNTPQNDMIQRLQGLENKLDSGLNSVQLLTALQSDPEIRAILEARAKGQKVKVTQDQPVEDPPLPSDDQLDNLKPSELVKVLDKKISTSVPNKMQTLVEQAVKERDQKIEALQRQLQELDFRQKKEKLSTQVEEARTKFPDFDKHSKRMLEINQALGGTEALSVEELYYLSKLRSGESLTKPQVATERPQSFAVASAKKRDKPFPSGERGFQQMLQESLSKLDVSEFRE